MPIPSHAQIVEAAERGGDIGPPEAVAAVLQDSARKRARAAQDRKPSPECGGFSPAELAGLFDSVKDPVDWRAPIRANVHPMLWPGIREAIIFYTATEPRVVGGTPDGRLTIEADGYRAGPAGDH